MLIGVSSSQVPNMGQILYTVLRKRLITFVLSLECPLKTGFYGIIKMLVFDIFV